MKSRPKGKPFSADDQAGQTDHVAADVQANEELGNRDVPAPDAPMGVCHAGWRITRLRVNAPCRPVNWRSQLAIEIRTHPDRRVVEKLTTWADDWVAELVALERRPVDRKHPLAQARALLEPERRPLRIEVEARLLAGQGVDEIAKVTGVEAGAVGWYHAAHFNCGDRLHARGYIVHQFLGSVPPSGDTYNPPLELARWYGYFGGLAMLEPVLDAFRYWQEDRRPARGGTAAELARRAARLWARAALLAQSLSVTNLSEAELRALLALAAHRKRNEGAR